MVGSQLTKDYYTGTEAQQNRSYLELTYPMINGEVDNWEATEHIFHDLFYKLFRYDPSELGGVHLIDNSFTRGHNHEKMATMMFETFNVKKLFISDSGAMPLYSRGRVSGLVLDSGDSITHTVATFEGFRPPQSQTKVLQGGRALTSWMTKLLRTIGEPLTSTSEFEMVREIKEKSCFVSQDYQKDLFKALSGELANKKYTLPDNREVNIEGLSGFMCPEILFQPNLGQNSHISIQ